MADIILSKVTQNRGDEIALNDVSLKLNHGEVLALLGPPGGGKTSLLRLIAGLEPFDSGRITIAGQDISRSRPGPRNVALVPRFNASLPHLTVYETLAFPLRLPALKLNEAEIRSRIEEIAINLQIDRFLPIFVGTLSTVDQVRVALGRAFVRDASLYLFDNPLAFLDSRLRTDLSEDLGKLLADTNATAIFATQDQSEAMALGDRIAIIDHGRIIQTGSPRELYNAPANVHVATQLGTPTICLLPFEVFLGGAFLKGALDGPPAPRATKTVGARPEHLLITKAVGRRKHQGVVQRVEPLGGYELLHIHLTHGQVITTLKPTDKDLKQDDRVTIAVKNPVWFDAADNRIAATG